ncbi:BA14K family protein [Rhizobiaceae bacterium BDR2-2]|uniref:Lectin-like protein BA14k n=1 Tax=Ectorhizobium quercum TaxID=2965071 RepID=A0AAE3STV0_9HYPH|nr:BA14K family protein [Ectorhizobium quercum]MCX8996352.1 BA14K family protein [Ectorhizobium quercum]MCX8998609.1 BA14K family protein [Ectorhizobium quercum]
MSRLTKTLLSAGLSAIMVVGTLLPVQAMPLVRAPAAVDANIELAQWDRRDYRHRPPPRYDDRRGPPRNFNRAPPPRQGWHNGHRGYRQARPGYRYHNGYWFPLAAFAAGAIIGGAASQPTVPRAAPSSGINPRHYDWCSSRYRSYRSYDNTFQPYNGPRQQCYSPYF